MNLSLSMLITLLITLQSTHQTSICEQLLTNNKKSNGQKNSQFLQSVQKLKSIVHDDCFVELSPNYYWAQNMSFVIVRFDFQMSSQTSPCAQVIHSKKQVTYQGFQLQLYCLQTDQIIRYYLNVKTFKNLNFHYLKWKHTQMNGLVLQCMKSPVPYFWSKLYTSNKVPQKKPKIWWQLQQKQNQQDDQIQKFMGLLQIDETQTQISSFVRKTNRKHQISDDSEIQFYCNQGSPFYQGSWY